VSNRKLSAGVTAKKSVQVKTRTTLVRIAVARLESTPVTPSFASPAVNPAKRAEKIAQISQLDEFIS
jgi:hypothetical protein